MQTYNDTTKLIDAILRVMTANMNVSLIDVSFDTDKSDYFIVIEHDDIEYAYSALLIDIDFDVDLYLQIDFRVNDTYYIFTAHAMLTELHLHSYTKTEYDNLIR